MKKKQPRKIAPVPQHDPDWLQSDAEGPSHGRQMQQKARVLPFLEQEWRDFERVCRRLAECGGAVEAAQAYGTPGQAQYGIDILVRLTDGTLALQAIRIRAKRGESDAADFQRFFDIAFSRRSICCRPGSRGALRSDATRRIHS